MSGAQDDCYFYYYSSCNKGDLCPFRHCEAALGSEIVCDLWKEKRCFRKICKFRHMEIKKDRSTIPCYWESQPGGCTKPHCAFFHARTSGVPPGLTPSGIYGQIIDDDVTMTSPVPQPVIPRRPSADQLKPTNDTPELPKVQVQQVVINPFEEESDQESIGGTPVKAPILERLQELKVPSKPAIVSLKRKAESTEKSEEDLPFGVKTLDDLRKEKLEQAKKLVEEANRLFMESGSSPIKIATAATAAAEESKKPASSIVKETQAEEEEPPKKVVKLATVAKSRAAPALPVKSYEEIQREKALQSMLRRRREKEKEAEERLKREKAAKESCERALRETRQIKSFTVGDSAIEQLDDARNIAKKPARHDRHARDTRKIRRQDSSSPQRDVVPVENTRRIIVSKDDDLEESRSRSPTRLSVKGRLKAAPPSKPSIKDRLGLGRDKVKEDKPKQASHDLKSIRGRLGNKETSRPTVKDRLGLGARTKPESDEDSLSVSSLSSDESVPLDRSPEGRSAERREKHEDERLSKSDTGSSSDSDDSLAHIAVKSLDEIRKEKAFKSLSPGEKEPTDKSRDSGSEDSVDRLPVKSLAQIRKERAIGKDAADGGEAKPVKKRTLVRKEKVSLKTLKGTKTTDDSDDDSIGKIQIKSLAEIRKEKQKQKVILRRTTGSGDTNDGDDDDDDDDEEGDDSGLVKVHVKSFAEIRKEKQAKKLKDDPLSRISIKNFAELKQEKTARKKQKSPVIIRRVKLADEDDSSESSTGAPVISLQEQRRQKELEEAARLKSLERREKALKKAQNWNRRALAADEEREKEKDKKELTRRLQRQPKQEIYKPPSLRRKENIAEETTAATAVSTRVKLPVSQERTKIKKSAVEIEKTRKPVERKTSAGWGSMTYSEVMREKQLQRQKRLQQQADSHQVDEASGTPSNGVEKKTEKRTFTPIVFDSKDSGVQAKKSKPSLKPITFDDNTTTTSKITVKTKTVAAPSASVDQPISDRKSNEAASSNKEQKPEPDSSSTPGTTAAAAARKISLRRSISKNTPAGRRLSAEKKRRASLASQKSDSTGDTKKPDDILEDDDLFTDDLLEDLLGDIDDVDADVASRTSKTEDDLLPELEELLA